MSWSALAIPWSERLVSWDGAAADSLTMGVSGDVAKAPVAASTESLSLDVVGDQSSAELSEGADAMVLGADEGLSIDASAGFFEGISWATSPGLASVGALTAANAISLGVTKEATLSDVAGAAPVVVLTPGVGVSTSQAAVVGLSLAFPSSAALIVRRFPWAEGEVVARGWTGVAPLADGWTAESPLSGTWTKEPKL